MLTKSTFLHHTKHRVSSTVLSNTRNVFWPCGHKQPPYLCMFFYGVVRGLWQPVRKVRQAAFTGTLPSFKVKMASC